MAEALKLGESQFNAERDARCCWVLGQVARRLGYDSTGEYLAACYLDPDEAEARVRDLAGEAVR